MKQVQSNDENLFSNALKSSLWKKVDPKTEETDYKYFSYIASVLYRRLKNENVEAIFYPNKRFSSSTIGLDDYNRSYVVKENDYSAELSITEVKNNIFEVGVIIKTNNGIVVNVKGIDFHNYDSVLGFAVTSIEKCAIYKNVKEQETKQVLRRVK